jgi:hypothetical protein
MWPFKRKELDIRSLPRLTDNDHPWGVAMCEIESGPLITRYNEAARKWMGHSAMPIKLGFAIPLNTPVEGGLPTPKENEQLNEIEDLIVGEIESRTIAFHAMTLTTGTMKEFIFYIPQGIDIATLHQAIQAATKGHTVQCMAEREPTWETCENYLPSP